MTLLKKVILVVATAVWCSFTAGHADADGPAHPYGRDRYIPCCAPQEFNWSGFYIGGHGAAAFSQADWNVIAPAEGFDLNDTSLGGGIHAGFQHQWGRMVAGFEVSYTWLGAEGSAALVTAPGTVISSETSDLLQVAAKLGYASDRWLAFAKAGYATAEIDLRSTTGGVTASTSDREHGWMMGIGIDYAVSNHLLLGVAYDWSFFSFDPRTVGGSQFDGREDIQSITARLTLLLGREQP